MNTKGIKFLAVLAVLAMAFAVFAVVTDSETSDADAEPKTVYIDQTVTGPGTGTVADPYKAFSSAIAAVSDKDTIVFKGDYDTTKDGASINLGGKAITLTSSDANKKSVITGAIQINETHAINAGTLEFKNLALKLNSMLGWGTESPAIATAVTLKVTNCDILDNAADSMIKIQGSAGNENKLSVVIDNCVFQNTPKADKRAITVYGDPTDEDVTLVVKNSKFYNYTRAIQADAYTNVTLDNNYFEASTDGYEGTALTKMQEKPLVQVSGTNAKLSVSITNTTLNLDIKKDGKAIDKPEFMFSSYAAYKYTIKSFSSDMNVYGDDTATATTITIPADVKVTIPEGKNLDLDNGNSIISLVVNGELENNGIITVGSTESITVGATGKITNKGAITDKGTITVSGTIANEGIIVVEKELSGTGKITGAGKVQVKNGGILNVYSGTSHQVYCSVDVYGGATFRADTVIYAATAGAVFGIGPTAAVKYATFKETVDSNFAITKAEFDVYADVTMNDGTWMSSNTYPDIVKVHGGTVTLGDNLVIGTNDEVTLEAGSEFKAKTASPIETITVNGKLTLAESAQYYSGITTETAKNVKIEGQGGSEEDVKKDTTTPAGGTIDSKTFTDLDNPTVIITDAAIKDAIVPTGRTVVINNAPTGTLDVSADGSQATVNTTANATFTVDTGAGVVKVTNLKGTFTFTRGSIVVEAKDWTGGDMELSDGDVLKMSGTVDAANVNITVVEGGKATVIIGSDETKLTINDGKKLTIAANIAVQIEGDVDGAGTLDVAEKVSVKGKFSAILIAAKDVDVYGEFSGKIDNTKKFIAHEKSDINGATVEGTGSADRFEGVDANGGSWSYSGNTLTLKNYNGNYNFKHKAATLTSIVLEGESKVTYTKAISDNPTVFFCGAGAMTIETVQGTGSLEISINMSKTTGTKLSTCVVTVIKGAAVKLDSVGLKITVSGSKSDWTADEIKSMKITAIDATTSFKMEDSNLAIDIMSAYEVDPEAPYNGVATGIASNSTITVNDGILSVKTAGNGVLGTALSVSNSAFGIESKLTAVTVTAAADAVTLSNSVVDIFGKDAIVSTGAGAIAISGCTVSKIQGEDFALVGNDGAAVTGDISVRNTNIEFGGIMKVKDVSISSGASVNVTDVLSANKVVVSQASTLEVEDMVLSGAGDDDKSVNNGTIIVNGGAAIVGDFENFASLNNKGIIGVYGKLTNADPGVLTNDGTLTVYKKESNFANTEKLTLKDDARSDDTKAKLHEISLVGAKVFQKADGSIAVYGATLSFDMKIGFAAKDLSEFDGYILPSQVDDSYILSLSNGTATVTVVFTYDAAKGEKIGDDLIITVSGVLVDETDSTKVLYLESNKSDKTIGVDADNIRSMWKSADSVLVLTSGNTVNNGTVILWSNFVGGVQAAAFNAADSTYEGNLISELDNITLGGTFSGDLISAGTGLVTVAKKMVGDVYAKGNVTVSGTLVGDVKVSLKAPSTAKLTVSGKMLGNLVYVSEYKAASTDTTDTVSTASIAIAADMSVTSGDAKSFEINLAAATNATTTTAGTPGYFTFGTLQAPEDAKFVVLELNAGMLKIPASISLPERYTLLVEKDTTIEVAKGATFNVKNAAMKVSKDATSNFEIGTVSETYGLVSFVMSFAIEDGAYTIYSDVAYALTNCDEGAELTVGSNAEISTNVAVKDGVNIIVNNVTLTFNGYDVDMADTAKFTVSGTGKIIFKASIDNGKPSDEPWEFYSVTANIVYDDDAVCFDGVRFTADSTIAGVAATSTAGSKISTTLLYNEGTAAIVAGNGTGSITLGNASYKLLKDDTAETLVSGSFIVAADAVFDAVAINDAFSVVDYEMPAGATVATIKEVKLMPTTVGVEGTLNLLNSTTVKGIYAGLGKITLAAGKEFILAKSDKVPTAEPYTNKTIPGRVAAKIVDTTDDENGYVLNIVSAKDDATLSIKATTLKIEGETVNAMTIAGDAGIGIITATKSAYLNALTLEEDSALAAEDVYIIGASKSVGYLGAVNMHMKEGTAVSDYSTLDYQATLLDDEYTVYTYFASIDFEDNADVTIVKGNIEIKEKLDLTGKDVNIVIGEDATLTLKAVMIIGTPITVLGDEGSSIVGKIKINGDNYLVAYADVDLSEAEIIGENDKDAAFSKLDVENVPYAAIFAQDYAGTIKLSKADATIIPEIVGYNFTAWLNYNGDAGAKIGETNAYADSTAILVTVMVKYVAGVDYDMNGVLFNVYDIPTDVPYGSYFTAKISDTTKYQGNPLINGLKTVVVDDDMILEASGVTPIPEPPAPEPVVGDSGLSLTDILLIVLVILIAIMVVILVLRLNRS